MLMTPEELRLLKEYLERHSDLKAGFQVEVNRVVFFWQGAWRRVESLKISASGMRLKLEGHKQVRMFPAHSRRALRSKSLRDFLSRLWRLLPGLKVVKICESSDRIRCQSAAVQRLLLHDGQGHLAGVLVPSVESPLQSERVLSSLVLWWDQLQKVEKLKQVVLFLPESWSERLLHAFPFLRIPIVCFKYGASLDAGEGPDRGFLRKVYPREATTSQVGTPYVIIPNQQTPPLRLRSMGESQKGLRLAFRRGCWELSYLGLRVAWYDGDREQYFFDASNPVLLTTANEELFREHLREVARYRCFPPADPRHPYYQQAHEPWLEAQLLKDHRLIEPSFADPVYSQVPTCLDGERRILDLLTVTEYGRLAVVELKIQKDLNLIFQSLDYWERVEYHLKRGDFQKAGYFPGWQLRAERPLLYLVAPLFDFHRMLPVIRKYLVPEIQVHCVGINLAWRKRLKVLRRFQF
jgi:hypothetical protein